MVIHLTHTDLARPRCPFNVAALSIWNSVAEVQLYATARLHSKYRGTPVHSSLTRHRASTSMYSLTFCVRFLLPERHQWKARIPDCRSNVENARRRRPVADGPTAPACRMRRAVLGAPPSPAERRRACVPAGGNEHERRPPAGDARRPRPAGRSHYVVISRDGRKLGTRVRVMLP